MPEAVETGMAGSPIRLRIGAITNEGLVERERAASTVDPAPAAGCKYQGWRGVKAMGSLSDRRPMCRNSGEGQGLLPG